MQQCEKQLKYLTNGIFAKIHPMTSLTTNEIKGMNYQQNMLLPGSEGDKSTYMIHVHDAHNIRAI